MRKTSATTSARLVSAWKLPRSVTAIAVTVALAACNGQPAPPPEEGAAVEVVAYTVESGQVPVSNELTGRVVAAVTAEIRPQAGGIVRRRLFTEGSEVDAGQILYEIDSMSAQTSVKDAEATLTRAKVGLASARAKSIRYQELVEIEAVSQESAEEAEAAYKQAISTVDSAEANLEAARIALSYANVTSPISGRIGRSNVSEGALVTANQTTALATVHQLDPIYFDATQSATEFLRIRQQFEQGEVKLDNGSPIVRLIKADGSFYDSVGKLELNDAVVNETTGTVTVRAQFSNPNGELIPGMYGKIRLEGAVMQNALVVPQVAIRRDVTGNALAYVIDENNTIQERTLAAVQTLGDMWIVESGLMAGERVVVEGLQKIRVGSVVSIAKNADKTSAAAATMLPASE